ncbi:hypothetical protein BaRGS_00034985, partial [Batillaria attramentaria]
KTVKKKDETCRICFSDYTRHGARQPKVLQCCFNVICRQCILSWPERCAFCRSEQRTAVDDLPTMDMRAAVLNELQKVERGNYADLRKAVEDWIIKVQRDACSTEAGQTATEELKSTSVWISNTLSSDLGLPVESPPPDSAAAEILCLGEDLPPFVLTLLDNNKKRNDSSSNSEGLFGDARDFTVDMARKLLWSLHGYCHCDFVVLPCTLNLEEDRIHVAALTNEVNEQLRRSRLYYHGPKRLTAHTLSQIMKATEALAAMSYVPCFLKDLSNSEDWILLLDTDWRNVVSLIIEAIGDKRKTNSESEQTARVTFTADSMFKVKVAMLEAARRLSFTQRVTIVTAALDVKRCIEKLQSQSSTDYKMDLQLSHMFPDALLQLDGSACVIAFGCQAPRGRKYTGNTLEITEYQPKTETEEDDAVEQILAIDDENMENPQLSEKDDAVELKADENMENPQLSEKVAFDFGCVIVMQYSAESARRMAGKEPGIQNVSTGNVSGGIVGANINVSGTGHRLGNTSTTDSHNTITWHSHNVYHAPVGMSRQHYAPAGDAEPMDSGQLPQRKDDRERRKQLET